MPYSSELSLNIAILQQIHWRYLIPNTHVHLMPEKIHPLEFMKQALDCRCSKCMFLEGKTSLDSPGRFVFLTALVSIRIRERDLQNTELPHSL